MRFRSSAITSSATGSPGCGSWFGCSSLSSSGFCADRWRNKWHSTNRLFLVDTGDHSKNVWCVGELVVDLVGLLVPVSGLVLRKGHEG
eukprot:2685798-Amphidinium_carterae.1